MDPFHPLEAVDEKGHHEHANQGKEYCDVESYIWLQKSNHWVVGQGTTFKDKYFLGFAFDYSSILSKYINNTYFIK